MSPADPFAGLQPEALWRHFAALTRIARPSGHEQAAVAYIEEWARRLGYPTVSDKAGNLCVHVPARAGHERAPALVLQGHLDIVCERADHAGDYDPEKGKIHIVRKTYDGEEWIEADLTTLGADNGIGCASALAVAEDPTLARGPLDLLFTVEEETGLYGAAKLDPSILRGRRLINLDSESDGTLTVGCAGGSDSTARWTRARRPVPTGWVGLGVSLLGLVGGHSGVEIHTGRLNANHGLARLLRGAGLALPLRFASFDGGTRHNVIARDARSVVFLPREAEAEFRAGLARIEMTLAEQYRGRDNAPTPTITPAPADVDTAFEEADTRTLLDYLAAVPSGVLALDPSIPGLVETSNNLSIIRTKGDTVEVVCSTRSSFGAAMDDVAGTLGALARLAGAELTVSPGYPGWKPDLNSVTLKAAREVYRRLFGTDPQVTAIHAGLECGVIGAAAGGMDMVSMGPRVEGAHGPGERVCIPSVARYYKQLAATVAELG